MFSSISYDKSLAHYDKGVALYHIKNLGLYRMRNVQSCGMVE